MTTLGHHQSAQRGKARFFCFGDIFYGNHCIVGRDVRKAFEHKVSFLSGGITRVGQPGQSLQVLTQQWGEEVKKIGSCCCINQKLLLSLCSGCLTVLLHCCSSGHFEGQTQLATPAGAEATESVVLLQSQESVVLLQSQGNTFPLYHSGCVYMCVFTAQ